MVPIKQTLKIIIILLVSISQALAALPQGLAWEVRTGGSDANGGAFDTGLSSTCTGGTDRSQQDAAFVAFNGTTITATTVAAGATIVITGYTVVATDVCNVLQISAGTNFTVGIYSISSVNAGANTWTLDRNATTAAGAAMVGNMGGGFLTIAKAVANWNGSGTDKIWIKTGTYTVTTAIQPVTNNDSGLNMSWVQGYGTVHGDTGTATITSSTNSINLWNINAGLRYCNFVNLNLTHTAGTRGDCFRASTTLYEITFINVSMDGCQIGINADGSTGDIYNLTFDAGEVKNTVAAGISGRCGVAIRNSYIHNNGTSGVTTPGCTNGIVHELRNNVFYLNGAHGFFFTNGTNLEQTIIEGNDFVSNVTDGVRLSSAASMNLILRNNVFYANGGYGINQTAGTITLSPTINGKNSYGANVTNPRNQVAAGTGDVTLTADPFVNKASNNFALNATVGGGAALKALGFPGVIPNAGTGFLDIGVLQSQASTSTGSNGAYVQ